MASHEEVCKSTPVKNENILLFGGAFDPPHIGHMELLRCAVRAVRPSSVLVMPSGNPPHKGQSTESALDRLKMCACFEEVFSPLRVSDEEIAKAEKSYTVNTLNALHKSSPDARLYLCMGGDMFRSFTAWHRYEDILRLAQLVVAGREEKAEDARMARDLRKMGGSVLFAPGNVPLFSSSDIRERIQKGMDVREFLPPLVYGYILKQGLYGITQST